MAATSRRPQRSFEGVLSEMTFEFFGSGQHKMSVERLFSEPRGVLLDVRSVEEVQTLSLPFAHDLTILHIPTHEIPDRLAEIPTDRPVAVFCSAGTRAAIVYAYLRVKGFEHVCILAGGLADLAEHVKPGKLWMRLRDRGVLP